MASNGRTGPPAPVHEFTKHPAHLKYLASGLDKQRQENRFCDVAVIVGGKRFPLHKSILTLTCKYFEAMFNSDFQEARSPEVTIEGSSDAFGRLMDFAYSGILCVPTDMLVDISQMACYLQFSQALKSCANVFKNLCELDKQFNPTILFPMSIMAQNYGLELESVVKQSVECLISNFAKFCESDTFLTDMTADVLETYLERDDLTALAKGMTEEQVLKAVTDWLKHDWDNRKEHAERLLKKVRLGVIERSRLTTYISGQIREEPGCRRLIQFVVHSQGSRDVIFTPRGIQVVVRLNNSTVANEYPLDYWHPIHTKWTHAFPGIDKNPQTKDLPISLNSINGQLYAGIRREDEFRNFVKFDEETRKWIELPVMETPLKSGVVVELDNYLYFVGGYTSGHIAGGRVCGSLYNQVRRFNTRTEMWEHVATIPMEADRGLFIAPPVAAAYKGFIFAMVFKGATSRLYVYNPGLDNWQDSELTLHIANEHKFVVDDGKLFRIIIDTWTMDGIDDGTLVEELICTGFRTNEQFTVTMGNENPGRYPKDGKPYTYRKDLFAVNGRIWIDLNGHFHKTEYHVEEWNKAVRYSLYLLDYNVKRQQRQFFCTHTFKNIEV